MVMPRVPSAGSSFPVPPFRQPGDLEREPGGDAEAAPRHWPRPDFFAVHAGPLPHADDSVPGQRGVAAVRGRAAPLSVTSRVRVSLAGSRR